VLFNFSPVPFSFNIICKPLSFVSAVGFKAAKRAFVFSVKAFAAASFAIFSASNFSVSALNTAGASNDLALDPLR